MHLIQSDGCENRVFLGNTDSQIIQLGHREQIYYSKSKGNEKRPSQNVITLFLRWETELQGHSIPFAWPPSLASQVQPARFSSNVIESVSAKPRLSHLQTPKTIGYKLLGLPCDIMKCKLAQSRVMALHATPSKSG